MGCCFGKSNNEEVTAPLLDEKSGSINFCMKCGTKRFPDAQFCSKCGQKYPLADVSNTYQPPKTSKPSSSQENTPVKSTAPTKSTTPTTPPQKDIPNWKKKEQELLAKREQDRKLNEERYAPFQNQENKSPVINQTTTTTEKDNHYYLAVQQQKRQRTPSTKERELRTKQKVDKKESEQQLYGLDRDLHQKTAKKYTPEEVDQAVNWLVSISGQRKIGDFPDCLKSGKILCGAINRIRPGLIRKVNEEPIPLLERENVRFYLEACTMLGVRSSDLFVINDLYDEKYLASVIQNIYALSNAAKIHGSFSGPYL